MADKHLWTFLLHSRLIQVLGCRLTRSADHLSLVFTPSQSSPAILLSPDSFDSEEPVSESRGHRLSGYLRKANNIVPFSPPPPKKKEEEEEEDKPVKASVLLSSRSFFSRSSLINNK